MHSWEVEKPGSEVVHFPAEKTVGGLETDVHAAG